MCDHDKQKNYLYKVYGTVVSSPFLLPELTAGEGVAEIVLRMGNVRRLPPLTNGTGIGFYATADEACYRFEGVGAFLIRKGSEVVIDPAPGVDDRAVRLSILGPVMTVLQHQRRRLLLHASAIAAEAQAVAFVAPSGQGKSTLAAVLEKRGYNIVADDKVVLDTNRSEFVVFPDCPRLKLWPESLTYLGERAENLPRLHPDFEKRSRPLTRNIGQSPLPLGCIYLLANGASPEIEPCKPQEALTEIMRNWAGARFAGELLHSSDVLSFFLQCAELVKNTSVYHLRRPASLAVLSQVVDLIENHLGSSISRLQENS